MPRKRSLSPEFFTDTRLLALPALVRLLFQGLWCWADREGRLQDEPDDLKLRILPLEQIDCDEALGQLAQAGRISRYEVDGKCFIQIINFTRHQSPHGTERPSQIPQQINMNNGYITVRQRLDNGALTTSYGSGSGSGSRSKGECEGESKPQPKPKPKKPDKDTHPLWQGCKWFRMSAHGYELARQWYAKERLPESHIKLAIETVENWLALGSTPTAKRARQAADHHLYLFETWVIEKALKRESLKNGNGTRVPDLPSTNRTSTPTPDPKPYTEEQARRIVEETKRRLEERERGNIQS